MQIQYVEASTSNKQRHIKNLEREREKEKISLCYYGDIAYLGLNVLFINVLW